MSRQVIALAMVIIAVAVASSSGYEVIDAGATAIPKHYQALMRRPLLSALSRKHLMLRGKTCEAFFKEESVLESNYRLQSGYKECFEYLLEKLDPQTPSSQYISKNTNQLSKLSTEAHQNFRQTSISWSKNKRRILIENSRRILIENSRRLIHRK